MKTTIVYKGKIVYRHTILHKILFLTELPQSRDFSKINKKDIINQGTPFYPFPSSLEQRDQNTILLYVLIRGSEVSHQICSKYNGIFIHENAIFIDEIQTMVRLASNYSSSYVHLTYI
jgi:hypothetical protein